MRTNDRAAFVEHRLPSRQGGVGPELIRGWESGGVGEWESGRVGEWESGRVGEWESGGVGEWGIKRLAHKSPQAHSCL
jgi:hypothetical protein